MGGAESKDLTLLEDKPEDDNVFILMFYLQLPLGSVVVFTL